MTEPDGLDGADPSGEARVVWVPTRRDRDGELVDEVETTPEAAGHWDARVWGPLRRP